MTQLLHGDCLELMATLPDNSVDAIITDPPYCSGAFTEAAQKSAAGQGLRSETIREIGWFQGDNMGTAGIAFLLRSVAFNAMRVLKDNSSLLVFCDWRMIVNLAPSIESSGLRYQNMIVWDKGNAGLGRGFRSNHEIILQFSQGTPTYHSHNFGNVIRCARISGERNHMTEKPVKLIESLIKVVCPPSGVVLDMFAGSGTTGVAAIQQGRDFIGIERDAKYFEIARKRIEGAASQIRMFD